MLSDGDVRRSNGILTQGIEPDSSVQSVVAFIEIHFEEFAKKMKGEITASEKALTDKLCKFLNRHASSYPFFFQHENVENHGTGKSPQTDFGTLSRMEEITVEDRSYGEFESFFSIEAKRLPTPGKSREKEYVVGLNRPSGGIERFKKGIHGKKLKHAAILGYIQKEDFNHWFLKINNWITELIIEDSRLWKEADKLVVIQDKTINLRKSISKCIRAIDDDTEDIIELYHFWINIIE